MGNSLRKGGGNWVAGDRFFDREVEIEALEERVEDRIHTLVTAQRRMGKTSLVRKLLRRLDELGDFTTVFVDVEDAATAADVVVEIAAESGKALGLGSRLKDWIAKLTNTTISHIDEFGLGEFKVKLRERIDAGSWRPHGNKVFASLAASGKPVVLAIDEFSIMVSRLLKGHDYEITTERRRDADEFLSWFRKIGQEHRGRITLVVSGSVGLEPILEQAELSAHANIFEPFDLKPWDEQTAIACLRELAHTYGLSIHEDVCRAMCCRLRCCVPHHVQQFFDKFHEYLRRANRSEASKADVEQVYNKEMLSVRGQASLEHYRGRLRMVLGDKAYKVALRILTQAAVSDGRIRDTSIRQYGKNLASLPDHEGVRIRDVLHVLEHDGYLTRDGDGYRFVSGLVEDWWRTRFGTSFMPFDQQLPLRVGP